MVERLARNRNESAAGSPPRWDVWGHEGAVERLRLAIDQDRLAHAYLIGGPGGVGKRATAREFARALSCQDESRSDRSQPCGRCRSCRKIARGTHPDVQSFSLASQAAMAEKNSGRNTALTIETVRQIRAATVLRPMESRQRVIIIEDSETLQDAAQEALLKTLEEPPPSVVIILLADDADLLLPTIQSRCQRHELRLVDRAVIAAALAAAGVEEERRHEIAALAGGRPGWALRAAADSSLIEQRREAVGRALAWIAASDYERIVTAVRLADTFTKRRAELFADLEILLGVWRDALLLRLNLARHLSFPWEAERLHRSIEHIDLDRLRQAIASVRTCFVDLEANVRPRLALEAMVLAWPTRPQ